MVLPAPAWIVLDEATAPTRARQHVSALAHGRADADDAAMIVSELCANALLHGAPPLAMRAWVDGVTLRIEVASDLRDVAAELITELATPRTMPPPDAERGRGLAIVEHLAARWGWHEHAGRLTVWAELD